MADRYIVKWQVQNREGGKWEDRYLGGFTMGRGGLGDYDAMIYPEGASKYPEAVAEWLCELLEATGVHPEMENLDATQEAVQCNAYIRQAIKKGQKNPMVIQEVKQEVKMKKIYEVRLVYEGRVGTDLFTGSKVQCNAYVRQAIKKGQTNPMVIQEVKQEVKKNG